MAGDLNAAEERSSQRTITDILTDMRKDEV